MRKASDKEMEINKKILASIFVIGLLAFAMGYGTYSYFSSTKTSTDNTFTAGILSMSTVTRSFSCPSGWAPGDSFTATWSLTNDGTIDIKYLAVDIYNYRYTVADLADVIDITEFKEYIQGHGWIDNLVDPQHYQVLVGDGASPLTLKELMQSYIFGTEPLTSGGVWDEFGNRVYHVTDWITGYGYDIVPPGTPAIAVGGTYILKLTFKFLESAGNAYQDATAKIDISFMGIQDLSQAP
jgi:predicted ribosomally synthesized peptide with SipW-like signal peptide